MMQIYGGCPHDIPHFKKLSPQSIISDGVEFVGFQVAYATGGKTACYHYSSLTT